MGAEQLAQHVELGLAQLGKLLGHVRDGAMVLADLHAGAHLAGRGGEPRRGECLGDFFGLRGHSLRCRPCFAFGDDGLGDGSASGAIPSTIVSARFRANCCTSVSPPTSRS